MKKRLYIYIGVVLLMTALVIASAIYENAYKVYLLPEISSVFRESVATSTKFGTHGAAQDAERTKTVMVDGESVNVSYNEMLSNEMYAYTSEDNRVTCLFDKYDGNIRMLSVEGWFPTAEEEPTEQAYLNWIYRQTAAYYEEDWSAYRFSCSTMVMSSTSGAPQQLQRDGYSEPSESETVSAYLFTFTKVIDGYETSDIIQAYIHPENGFAALEFSAHDFDSITLPKVDTARVSREIKSFLRASLNFKEHTYIRHELRQPKFAYIHNTLCLICSVSMEVTAENGTQVIDQQLAVIIQ